jgi:uncharacterized Zn finger protein
VGGFRDWAFKPYVSAAERRLRATREMEQRRKKGQDVSPVVIEGRAIVKTFWGKAWCENLERYSDYANRLPRGRTYVRNGSVVDLRIEQGAVHAMVSGSLLYEVVLNISSVEKNQWESICEDCAGRIDSLVELLQGRLSQAVMERICRQQQGLFPAPAEIKLSCSCPDWAAMCKHVAAVLYGVGARLDEQPELLFRLRGVDEKDLLSSAGKSMALGSRTGAAPARALVSDDLGEMFGLDMADSAISPSAEPVISRRAEPVIARRSKPKAAAKHTDVKTPGRAKKRAQKDSQPRRGR